MRAIDVAYQTDVNMKKTGLKGCVYDFSVHYDAIEISDILYIHKYLMEKMR